MRSTSRTGRRPGPGWVRPSAVAGVSHGVGRQLRAQLGEGLGEQAGDVHLGDADLVGDLGLGQDAEEAQGEDLLFALVEGGQETGRVAGRGKVEIAEVAAPSKNKDRASRAATVCRSA